MDKQLPQSMLDRLSRAFSIDQSGDLTKSAEMAIRYLTRDGNTDSGDQIQTDETISLLICCYGEAAKLDLSPDDLEEQLKRSGVSEERIRSIRAVYKNHRIALRQSVLRLGWHPPHVLGVDWKLIYSVKGNVQGTIGRPSYLVSLKVQDCDSALARDLTFGCSVEQLQDLVWKLKEATKTVQKLANQGS